MRTTETQGCANPFFRCRLGQQPSQERACHSACSPQRNRLPGRHRPARGRDGHGIRNWKDRDSVCARTHTDRETQPALPGHVALMDSAVLRHHDHRSPRAGRGQAGTHIRDPMLEQRIPASSGRRECSDRQGTGGRQRGGRHEVHRHPQPGRRLQSADSLYNAVSDQSGESSRRPCPPPPYHRFQLLAQSFRRCAGFESSMLTRRPGSELC